MFDTDAVFEWVLGNLYMVGGAVGAVLLITLVVLLLLVRRRKLKGPSIEDAFGVPEHDASVQGYVDPYVDPEAGQAGSLGGFDLDSAPVTGQAPATPPPSGPQEPLPPDAPDASSQRQAAPAVPAIASPFANAAARVGPSAGDDHVRKVMAGLLEGQGGFSGPEMRRLELLRPEKILEAVDALEPTISGRNKGTALARLAKIRQHAELLATGAPIAHPSAPTQSAEVADAAPPAESMARETLPDAEQTWPDEPPEPAAEPSWQEPPMEAVAQEPAAEQSWPEPAWQEPAAEPPWPEPAAEPPAESGWQEPLPDVDLEGVPSWQHSLTPPPETVPPVPPSKIPDAESNLPMEPVFQRNTPRNDSHWLPGVPAVPAVTVDAASDGAPVPTAALPSDVAPAAPEPADEPLDLGSDEPTDGPSDLVLDEPAEEQPAGEHAIEEDEEPEPTPDTWDIHENLVPMGRAESRAEVSGVGRDNKPEYEPEPVEGPGGRIEQESRTLEPLEVRLETAEDVLALDAAEQTDALAFLNPSELGRAFAAATEKQLKLSVIDLLSHLETVEALEALQACLDDPDPEIQLYALDAAERLLGEE
ncbi:MAG: hypothetical protein KKA32_01210 [Actinobacteria bacterium]|nr:hypothetical protein [Actinomycetota bacterium]